MRKLGRARSDDQEQPPRSQTPHISSPANEGKVPLLPPGQAGSMPVSTIVGGASRAAAMFEEAGGSGESASLKGRVQQWIQEQSAEFLDRWVKSSKHHPELDVVKKLAAATKELDLRLPTCTTALSVSVRRYMYMYMYNNYTLAIIKMICVFVFSLPRTYM